MILEEETFEKYGYSSSDLKPRSWKKIIVACDDCGKIHTTAKHDYRVLCKSCSQKRKRLSEEHKKKIGVGNIGLCKGKNHYNWKGGKVKRICEICKKEFEITPSAIRKGGGKFCSKKCMGEANKGANNPSWKGGKVKRICPICGKPFYVIQSAVKKGVGKYCSYSCSAKGRMRNAKTYMTAPEKTFEDICKRKNLPFHFVGDGSLWIGKKGRKQLNPDFIEINGKKVLVEVMGDYWHSPLLNKNMKEHATLEYRKRHYRRYKWHPIFIWESDLKREDADAFVLNKLRGVKSF